MDSFDLADNYINDLNNTLFFPISTGILLMILPNNNTQLIDFCDYAAVSYTHLDVYKRQMLESATEGKFDYIITKSAKRVSKNLVELLQIMRYLKERSISVKESRGQPKSGILI